MAVQGGRLYRRRSAEKGQGYPRPKSFRRERFARRDLSAKRYIRDPCIGPEYLARKAEKDSRDMPRDERRSETRPNQDRTAGFWVIKCRKQWKVAKYFQRKVK